MVLVEESMPIIMFDTQRLAVAFFVDETDRDEVVLNNSLSLGDGEGVTEDGLDRTPDVDDLDAAFDEFVGVFREVKGDT